MDNKCPKCGSKLSVLYIKQNCPECGCDLLYYNMEENLEKDAEQAEKEFEALAKFLDKVTPAFIRNKKAK
ncbi:MAG: hypothetical protein IJW86_06695 [Clostridia bacterium]|nr:hypothetical protein [Clostridia bacterium]